jgi:hypothetical protein
MFSLQFDVEHDPKDLTDPIMYNIKELDPQPFSSFTDLCNTLSSIGIFRTICEDLETARWSTMETNECWSVSGDYTCTATFDQSSPRSYYQSRTLGDIGTHLGRLHQRLRRRLDNGGTQKPIYSTQSASVLIKDSQEGDAHRRERLNPSLTLLYAVSSVDGLIEPFERATPALTR